MHSPPIRRESLSNKLQSSISASLHYNFTGSIPFDLKDDLRSPADKE